MMKLVYEFLGFLIISLVAAGQDYYKDENGRFYSIGQWGQRRYAGDPYEKQGSDEHKYRDQGEILNFGWNLFRAIDNPNFVVSPLSPQLLLSYLVNQTEGATKNQIGKVIGKKQTPEEMESLVENILSEPGSDERLKIGSAFFLPNDFKIKKSFWDYKPEVVRPLDVVQVDFKKSQQVKDQLNKWVSKSTNKLIKKLDADINQNTKMLLASTIYYSGKWIFNFKSTKSQFTLPDGEEIEVEAMQIKKKYHSGTFSNVKATWGAIPYNSTESMVIILPDEGEDIDKVIELLQGQDFVDIINTITGYPTDNWLNITLPKFKISSSVDLKKPLEKLGIKNIFSDESTLSLFENNEKQKVSEAIQQSVLEVNESGSIGASATSFSVVALTIQPDTDDRDIIVDRPFIAMIVDRKYAVPYFIAKVSDPRST